MEKALEMLEKSEKLISSSERQRAAYEHLITQYAVLGKKMMLCDSGNFTAST